MKHYVMLTMVAIDMRQELKYSKYLTDLNIKEKLQDMMGSQNFITSSMRMETSRTSTITKFEIKEKRLNQQDYNGRIKSRLDYSL